MTIKLTRYHQNKIKDQIKSSSLEDKSYVVLDIELGLVLIY